MVSCKNCVHFSVCRKDRRRNRPDEETPPNWCKYFINTADVVEVVRCKDCKHCEDLGMSGLWCNHPDNRNPLGCRPEDFCKDGERVIKFNDGQHRKEDKNE